MGTMSITNMNVKAMLEMDCFSKPPLQGVFDTRSYGGKVHYEACKLIVGCKLFAPVPFEQMEFEY